VNDRDFDRSEAALDAEFERRARASRERLGDPAVPFDTKAPCPDCWEQPCICLEES
jgi:hypothetical protein